ncbi:conserved hypothetical protein [Vibrio chagasii]|nr:conserved hypothetical protein [Vibrio chagasii]CAH7355691.1 conserved hypothetical protein [Vibrio chagasii]
MRLINLQKPFLMSAPSFYVPNAADDAADSIHPSQLGFINNIGIIDDEKIEEFAAHLNNPVPLEQAGAVAKGFIESHLTKVRTLIHVPDIRIKYGYKNGLIDLVIDTLQLTEEGWEDVNLGRSVLSANATLEEVTDYARRIIPVIETITLEQIEDYSKKGMLAYHVADVHSGGISLHLEHGTLEGELSVNNIPSLSVVDIVLQKHGMMNHAVHLLSSRYAIHTLNSRSFYELLSLFMHDVESEIKNHEQAKLILRDVLAAIGVSRVKFGDLDPICSEISDMMLLDSEDTRSEIFTFLKDVGGDQLVTTFSSVLQADKSKVLITLEIS